MTVCVCALYDIINGMMIKESYYSSLAHISSVHTPHSVFYCTNKDFGPKKGCESYAHVRVRAAMQGTYINSMHCRTLSLPQNIQYTYHSLHTINLYRRHVSIATKPIYGKQRQKNDHPKMTMTMIIIVSEMNP